MADRCCENCGWSETVGSPIMCNFNGHRTFRDEICQAWKPKGKDRQCVKPFHRCNGSEYTLIEDSHFDFCPYCGEPIDWGNEGEQMAEYIVKPINDDDEEVLIREWHPEELIRCMNCKKSSPNHKFCYEWWNPTSPNGYCHKAKAKDGEKENV